MNPDSPDTKDLPPFIPDQRIYALSAPGNEGLLWMTRRFTSLRERDETGVLKPVDDLVQEQAKSRHGWDEVRDRTALLTDPNIRLLLITQNAGMGKTKCLESTQHFRMAADSGQLCLRCEFADLPRKAAGFLAGGENCWLVDLVYNSLEGDPDRGILLRLIERKISSGELNLLVDATDQTNLVGGNDQEVAKWTLDQAAALATFLNKYPGVRCVVAGRPDSIIRLWEKLFAAVQPVAYARQPGRNPHWQLVQIGEFTPDQAERFVGEGRMNKIRDCGADLLAVPRSLETIRRLEPDQLEGVRTAADIYWLCLERVIEAARTKQTGDLPADRIRMLMALLAWEQVRRGWFAGARDTPSTPSRESSSHDRTFLRSVWKRHRRWLHREWDYPDEETLSNAFSDDVARVVQLNLELDPGVFSPPANYLEKSVRRIVFINRTMQDFLAALFVTKFRPEPVWLQKRGYLRGWGARHYRNGDWYDFWRYTAEMPPEARDDTVYVRSMASLFVECRKKGTESPAPLNKLVGERVRRSTEMIWRAWWPLMELATDRRFTSEAELFAATTRFQKSVRERFQRGDLIWPVSTAMATKKGESGQAASRTASMIQSPLSPGALNRGEGLGVRGSALAAYQLLEHFLLEFLALADGRIGDQNQQRLAAAFDRHVADESRRKQPEHGFVGIPAGKFHYGEGDNAKVLTQSAEFWLSRFPVTNELIRLFDPRHGGKEDAERFDSDYGKYSAEPACPAIYCDWYTSWTLATWLHGMLPDEQMWESAARGEFRPPKPATEYGFEGGTERLREHGWTFANSAGKAHPVGGAQETKLPNGFGLYHMHGSVWEWTSSWVESGQQLMGIPSRCLRGGSFDYIADLARCANRNWYLPAFAYLYVGLRVARA